MSSRYLNTLLKLVPQVLQLQEQLQEAVQNGDMETSHGICRIAVSLGENHSRYTQFSTSQFSWNYGKKEIAHVREQGMRSCIATCFAKFDQGSGQTDIWSSEHHGATTSLFNYTLSLILCFSVGSFLPCVFMYTVVFLLAFQANKSVDG